MLLISTHATYMPKMYSYLFIVVVLLLEVHAGDGVWRRWGHVVLAGRRGDGGVAGGGRTHGMLLRRHEAPGQELLVQEGGEEGGPGQDLHAVRSLDSRPQQI